MNPTQDCYRGALVGAAIGDALGATVDELSREQIKAKHGVHREIVGGGRLKSAAGEVGIDTKLALAVAQSLAENGETDIKDVATRMVASYGKISDTKGAGPTTRAALEALKPKGKDVFSAARKVSQQKGHDVAGSGSVVRVAPVGMLRRVQFKEMIVETINVCRLTHYDQRSVDACIAFNFGISYLTSGKDPSKLLFKTWRFLMDSRAGKDYRELVGEQEPAQDMVKSLKAVNDIQYDDLKANGQAIETTQAAYWLLLNAIDFEEGLVRAVNLGGDAATMGAVAGALLGARFGEHAMPERWLESLAMRKDLETVSDRLCKLGEPKK
ncbi:MAG: ADP-ribosylglycohydrolase family protein [Candidatus Sumerlaeaceae bacterium]|nr:ADP-ribosylglycohydrolase family protein [Candidatus Sumerlaeaceae bacterium]